MKKRPKCHYDNLSLNIFTRNKITSIQKYQKQIKRLDKKIYRTIHISQGFLSVPVLKCMITINKCKMRNTYKEETIRSLFTNGIG